MSFVPLHLLARAARRDVTVALTGEREEQLFVGYPTMAADWWHRLFSRVAGPPPQRWCAAAAPCPGGWASSCGRSRTIRMRATRPCSAGWPPGPTGRCSPTRCAPR